MQRTIGNVSKRPGSGNNQRRMRLVVTLPEIAGYSEDELNHILAHGSSGDSAVFDLHLVENRTEVIRSLVNFNWTARSNVVRTTRLLTGTSYWVFEPTTGQFAPSKFAGFQEMTLDIYDHANQIKRPIFNGHRTRLAIEAAVGTEFSDTPKLRDSLIRWAEKLLQSGVLSGVDTNKWRFLSVGTIRSPASYRGFGRAPSDDPDELQTFARRVRRGQSEFRAILLDLYGYRCAVTGHGPANVLEACHIATHAETGINDSGNGILLRSDIHDIFDDGLLKIEPGTCRIVIDESLRNSPYWDLRDKTLRPRRNGDQPSDEYLVIRWKNT